MFCEYFIRVLTVFPKKIICLICQHSWGQLIHPIRPVEPKFIKNNMQCSLIIYLIIYLIYLIGQIRITILTSYSDIFCEQPFKN